MQRVARVVRRISRRAALRPFRPHGLILLYHRVAAPRWDPWHNCVRPAHFEAQLAFLRRVADIVPLTQLNDRLRRRGNGRPVVSITFDDGYADNLHAALPLLEKYQAPATVFVATAWVGKGKPFWWDRLSALLLAMETIPPSIRLRIGSGEFTWRAESAAAHPRKSREQLHLALWSRLLLASAEDREQAFDQLRGLVGADPPDDTSPRPLTVAELRQLAASPLVEIGAHTMNHCSLPDLPPAAQLDEIAGSRDQVRTLTGSPPSTFAYPFGGFDARTPGLVAAAGFELACSSQNDLVWAGCNRSLLPRIQVRDYSPRTFALRFTWEWLP